MTPHPSRNCNQSGYGRATSVKKKSKLST